MPTVAKTSEREIVRAARRIIERGGLAGLSLQAVAKRVGVQPPSLYKRFADRAALVQAVAREVGSELQTLQENAAITGTAAGDLRAIAVAQRAFARASPHLYLLVFGAQPEAALPPVEYHAFAATLIDRVKQLTGPRHALDGARLLVAFTHGFVSMELAGAFHLGGELDAAFRFGLDRLLASLEPATPPRAAKTRRAR